MIDFASLAGGALGGSALVGSRIAGFVAVSPWPGGSEGTAPRVALFMALTLLAAPFAMPIGLTMDARLVPASISELAIGLLVGITFRVVLSAGEVAAGIASQSTGLSSAALYDPTLDAHETALGRAITLCCLLLALSVGAHRVALSLLLESFRALPVGSTIAPGAATNVLVHLCGEAIATGVRLAMPMLAISLVVQIALAVIARAAPSLQIFNVGLAVLIGGGLLVLSQALPDMGRAYVAHLEGLARSMEAVLGAAKP